MIKLIQLLIFIFLVGFSSPNADAGFHIPSNSQILTKLGASNRTGLDPNSIRVLVWNLYKGEKEQWPTDFEALTNNRDVLLLQEFYLNQRMTNAFLSVREMIFHNAASFIYTPEWIRTGVSTGSAVKPSMTSYYQSKVREPVVGTPKMTLFNVLPIEGSKEKLLVVNIHAVNFVTTAELVYQLRNVTNVIKKFKGPVIFAGDFNTWSYGKTQALKNIARSLNLKEVNFPSDTRTTFMGYPLDHILYRGLEVKYSWVYESFEGSDHKALAAEFSLSGE